MKNTIKISCDPYTEGISKFGCGAGLFHSYIDSNGDLYPCDFLPLSFGNSVKETLPEIWLKMRDKILESRVYSKNFSADNHCLAQKFNKFNSLKKLPISCNDCDLSIINTFNDEALVFKKLKGTE